MKYIKIRVALLGILTFTFGLFPLIIALAGSHGHFFASKDILIFLLSPVFLIALTILLIIFIIKKLTIIIWVLKIMIPATVFAYITWIFYQYTNVNKNEELLLNPIYYVLDVIIILLVISFSFDVYKDNETHSQTGRRMTKF